MLPQNPARARATGNTFTAGNLDIKLSTTSTGPWGFGPINGFWDSPTGWAPGETFSRTLYFKNVGNVAVQVVLLDFKNYVSTVGPSTFRDVIEVVSFYEFVEGMGINYAPHIDNWYGNDDGTLTLHELMASPNDPGTVGNCDVILFDAFMGACTAGCTANNIALMGGTYLAPGQVGWLKLGFKFSSTAGSEYENAECSFDLQMSFIQGPDSGVCRHELPGFIPGT